MRRSIGMALAVIALQSACGTGPAGFGALGYYQVAGVEDDDMLKMRRGPGTGFKVMLGLPNGTALRVNSCQQTGGTRWCEVSLKQASNIKGHVSWAYLEKM